MEACGDCRKSCLNQGLATKTLGTTSVQLTFGNTSFQVIDVESTYLIIYIYHAVSIWFSVYSPFDSSIVHRESTSSLEIRPESLDKVVVSILITVMSLIPHYFIALGLGEYSCEPLVILVSSHITFSMALPFCPWRRVRVCLSLISSSSEAGWSFMCWSSQSAFNHVFLGLSQKVRSSRHRLPKTFLIIH